MKVMHMYEYNICRECGIVEGSGLTWKSRMKDSDWTCSICEANTPIQAKKTWFNFLQDKLLIVRLSIVNVKNKIWKYRRN